MNENIDLTKILEGCEGMTFYSSVYGECKLKGINPCESRPLVFVYNDVGFGYFGLRTDGKSNEMGECVIFPSKDQRDWSKFEKPSRFPKTFEEARSSLTEGELCTITEDLDTLSRLIVVRNAWWKADDNWKPDWSALSPKHCIVYSGGRLYPDSCDYDSKILAFRTPELRDIFLKNHRDLINRCKDYI